jgi:hypothetical protein
VISLSLFFDRITGLAGFTGLEEKWIFADLSMEFNSLKSGEFDGQSARGRSAGSC